MLFADVVRSLEIAATLDMERLRDIITELLERSAAAARRYGGGTAEYTGDGLMVIFGAPAALEDHAVRACLAALAIQRAVGELATEVARGDGVTLQMRVGLNSGRVIAGEVGLGSPRYAATGETVGFAHRMQAAAPAGGVLLSDTTARLVEHIATLAEPEWVHIKGSARPVRARCLLSVEPRDAPLRRTEGRLVGRRGEMATLDAVLQGATDRRGGIVNVVGPAGMGKSRLAREAAMSAAGLGMEVCWAFCESHTRDVPFYAVTRLLRAANGLADLDDGAARAKVRERSPDADPIDLLLLDDLLGIADPDLPLPQMDPDIRRRRLTALISSRTMARTHPALFILEDAHWIDAVSESMLAEFLAVISQAVSIVLITSRPDYAGALLRVPGAQLITLDPLSDSAITELLDELLGRDASVAELSATIAERAAGNPFFAEEMTREMVQQGVLTGDRGDYFCDTDITEVSVPDTVAAAIGARIDRLSAPARETLNAAAVIGTRFDAELLCALGVDEVLDELLGAELIDQVRFSSTAEYAFRHPLIRAVAYEAQLKSARAKWHRRLAAAIQHRTPGSVEEHAALIAEHLEAAGDLWEAYDWHMRAGAWSTNRDLVAARTSWERAQHIADALPAAQLSMRIAPRTMLCATDLQARDVQQSRSRFAELQDLCGAAGDKVSLAIGMSAAATEALYSGRPHEAAHLASQHMALFESVDDLTPVMGLASVAFCSWHGIFAFDDILRWTQRIVDMAAGDPGVGAGYGVASPLAIAMAWRGTARWCTGRPGWCEDLHDAVEMAQSSNAETFSGAIAWSYGFAMQFGMLQPDDHVLAASEHALRTAHRASSDRATGLAGYTLAVALLNRDDPDERHRGVDLMRQTRELWLRKRALFLLPVTDVWVARDTARHGDCDAAIEVMRPAVDELRRMYPFYGVWGTGVLVETLLERGGRSDVAEAFKAIDWLATLATDGGAAVVNQMLSKLSGLAETVASERH
nr:adenylate/guanylate cyclase domain-containing protein [Mycolicibacterium rutilum]